MEPDSHKFTLGGKQLKTRNITFSARETQNRQAGIQQQAASIGKRPVLASLINALLRGTSLTCMLIWPQKGTPHIQVELSSFFNLWGHGPFFPKIQCSCGRKMRVISITKSDGQSVVAFYVTRSQYCIIKTGSGVILIMLLPCFSNIHICIYYKMWKSFSCV